MDVQNIQSVDLLCHIKNHITPFSNHRHALKPSRFRCVISTVGNAVAVNSKSYGNFSAENGIIPEI